MRGTKLAVNLWKWFRKKVRGYRKWLRKRNRFLGVVILLLSAFLFLFIIPTIVGALLPFVIFYLSILALILLWNLSDIIVETSLEFIGLGGKKKRRPSKKRRGGKKRRNRSRS